MPRRKSIVRSCDLPGRSVMVRPGGGRRCTQSFAAGYPGISGAHSPVALARLRPPRPHAAAERDLALISPHLRVARRDDPARRVQKRRGQVQATQRVADRPACRWRRRRRARSDMHAWRGAAGGGGGVGVGAAAFPGAPWPLRWPGRKKFDEARRHPDRGGKEQGFPWRFICLCPLACRIGVP